MTLPYEGFKFMVTSPLRLPPKRVVIMVTQSRFPLDTCLLEKTQLQIVHSSAVTVYPISYRQLIFLFTSSFKHLSHFRLSRLHPQIRSSNSFSLSQPSLILTSSSVPVASTSFSSIYCQDPFTLTFAYVR